MTSDPGPLTAFAFGRFRQGKTRLIVSDVINIEDIPDAYAVYTKYDATNIVINMIINRM